MVLVAAAALAATLTGTVMTMLPTAAPVAMTQLLMFNAPAPGQPLNVPPVAVIAPLVVMPVGSVSARVIGAVVAAPLTAIVMV
jgi:hypothetical protein